MTTKIIAGKSGFEAWEAGTTDSDGNPEFCVAQNGRVLATVSIRVERNVIPASRSASGYRRVISRVYGRMTVRLGYRDEFALLEELSCGAGGTIGALKEIMRWMSKEQHLVRARLDLEKVAGDRGIEEYEIIAAMLGNYSNETTASALLKLVNEHAARAAQSA